MAVFRGNYGPFKVLEAWRLADTLRGLPEGARVVANQHGDLAVLVPDRGYVGFINLLDGTFHETKPD